MAQGALGQREIDLEEMNPPRATMRTVSQILRHLPNSPTPSELFGIKPADSKLQHVYKLILEFLVSEFESQALLYEINGENKKARMENESAKVLKEKLKEYSGVSLEGIPVFEKDSLERMDGEIKLLKEGFEHSRRTHPYSAATFETKKRLEKRVRDRSLLLRKNLKFIEDRLELASLPEEQKKKLEKGDYSALEGDLRGRLIEREFAGRRRETQKVPEEGTFRGSSIARPARAEALLRREEAPHDDISMEEETLSVLRACEEAGRSAVPPDEAITTEISKKLQDYLPEGANWRVTSVDRTGVYVAGELENNMKFYGRIGTNGAMFFVEKECEGKRIWATVNNDYLRVNYSVESGQMKYQIVVDTRGSNEFTIMKRMGDLFAGVSYFDGHVGLSLESAKMRGMKFVIYEDAGKIRQTFRIDDLSELWGRDPSLRAYFAEEVIDGKPRVVVGIGKQLDSEGRRHVMMYMGSNGRTIRYVENDPNGKTRYVEYVSGGDMGNILRYYDKRDRHGKSTIWRFGLNVDKLKLDEWEMTYLMPLGRDWRWGLTAGGREGSNAYFGFDLERKGIRFLTYYDGSIKHRIYVENMAEIMGSRDPTLRMAVWDNDGQVRVGMRKKIDDTNEITVFIDNSGGSSVMFSHEAMGTSIDMLMDTSLSGVSARVVKSDKEWDYRFSGKFFSNGKAVSDVYGAVLKNLGHYQIGVGWDPRGWNMQFGWRDLGLRAVFSSKGGYYVTFDDIQNLTGEENPRLRFVPVTISGSDGKLQTRMGMEYIIKDDPQSGEKRGAIMIFESGKIRARLYTFNEKTGFGAWADISDKKLREIAVQQKGKQDEWRAGLTSGKNLFAEYLRNVSEHLKLGARYDSRGGLGLEIAGEVVDGIEVIGLFNKNGLSWGARLSENALSNDPTKKIYATVDSNGSLGVEVQSMTDGRHLKTTRFSGFGGRWEVGYGVTDTYTGGQWRVGVGEGGISAGISMRNRDNIFTASMDGDSYRAGLYRRIGGDFLIGAGFANGRFGFNIGVDIGGYPMDLATISSIVTLNPVGIALSAFSYLMRRKEKKKREKRERQWSDEIMLSTNSKAVDALAHKEERMVLDGITYKLPKPEEIEREASIANGTIVVSRFGKNLTRINIAEEKDGKTIYKDYVLKNEDGQKLLEKLYGAQVAFEEKTRDVVLTIENSQLSYAYKESLVEKKIAEGILEGITNGEVAVSKSASGDVRLSIKTRNEHGESSSTLLVSLEDLRSLGIIKGKDLLKALNEGKSAVITITEENGEVKREIKYSEGEGRDNIEEIKLYFDGLEKDSKVTLKGRETEEGTIKLQITIEKADGTIEVKEWVMASFEFARLLYDTFGESAVEESKGKARIEYTETDQDFEIGAQGLPATVHAG